MILTTRWGRRPTGSNRRRVIAFAVGVAILGMGCRRASDSEARPSAGSRKSLVHPITLGDVEADEPLRRVRWIQPLADHLAAGLKATGIDGGQVKVARSLDEMASFLRDGTVDLYLDSPLPVLKVAQASNARILLRRWVRDEPDYRSLFLTHGKSGLRAPADLDGRTIAFQERHSTTGFLLPALTLIERGYEIKTVSEPAATVQPGQVGCFFTGDEENSIQLLLAEVVAAAVVSNQDYEDLPDELRQSLEVLDTTPSLPRQLVAVRPGMDPALVAAVRSLLLGLTDGDRTRLAKQVDGEGWTWRFDQVPPESLARLETYSAKLADLAVD